MEIHYRSQPYPQEKETIPQEINFYADGATITVVAEISYTDSRAESDQMLAVKCRSLLEQALSALNSECQK